jgi:hypothetical protein
MDSIANVSIRNIPEKLKFIEEIRSNLARSGYWMETPADPDSIIIQSIFFQFVLPDYKPQGVQDVFEGLMHLMIYWQLWPKSRAFIPTNALNPEWLQHQERGEAMLEIALAKLAYQAGILIQSAVSEDQKKNEKAAKIRQLNLKKMEAASERIARILNAFNYAKKSPGDTLNKIIMRIRSIIGKDSKEIPSEVTIRRVLQGNKQLMDDCFDKKGRFYIIKSNV